MTNFNFPSTFSPVTRKWTTHYSRIEGCLRFTRHSNQRFPEKGRNWDAGHLNYAFLLKRREQSITVSLGGRGEGMGGGIEAARNRACTTDRDLRYYVSHSHHPKLDDPRGMQGLGNGWSSASCRDDYRPYNRSVFNSLSECSNRSRCSSVVQTRADEGLDIISNAPLGSSVILRGCFR